MSNKARTIRCLGVIHVPKVAGTSLRSAFVEIPGTYTGPKYFDEPYYGSRSMVDAIPMPNRDTTASLSDLTEIVKSNRLVIGHYSAGSLRAAGCTHLAMQVREPRARLLSLYRFWQQQSASVRASWGLWGHDVVSKSDLPLRDFLASPSVRPAVDNLFSRFALARTPQRQRFGRLKALSSPYKEFKQSLSVMGWSSHGEAFLESVCELMGEATVPRLGHVNATDVETIGAQRLEDLDDET